MKRWWKQEYTVQMIKRMSRRNGGQKVWGWGNQDEKNNGYFVLFQTLWVKQKPKDLFLILHAGFSLMFVEFLKATFQLLLLTILG